MSTRDETLEERFLRHGWDEKPSGCWEWRSSKAVRGGYGQLTHGHKLKKAHRVSYEVFVGPIPAGMFVCHKCDNPPCVNPAHLFLGTPGDNHKDMHRKQRGFVPEALRGSKHPSTKLTEQDVIDIKNLLRAGETPQVEIARKYGVSKTLITRIKKGKTWTTIQ